MLVGPAPSPLCTYRDALARAWKDGILPYTTLYGKDLEVSPELIHVAPWFVLKAPDTGGAEAFPGATGGEFAHKYRHIVPSDDPVGYGVLDPHSAEGEHPPRVREEMLLTNYGSRGIVVLGGPGAGKSTFVWRFAFQALGREDRIPIVLPLTALVRHPELQIHEVAAELWRERGAPGLESIFREALERGHAVILLDGLDEVGERRRRQYVAQRIAKETSHWCERGNRWLVTSRPEGYYDSPLPGIAVVTAMLQEWGVLEVEKALLGWNRALKHWLVNNRDTSIIEAEARVHALQLRDQILGDSSLWALARTPLSLAMLVLIERANEKLPEHRVLLYQTYVHELLRRRPQPVEGIDASEFLLEIAWWIQREHPLGRVHVDALMDECVRIALRYEGFAQVDEADEQIIALSKERALAFFSPDQSEVAGGIMRETEPEFFAFSHRALQEFFLGRALARMPTDRRWEFLRPRLHASRWREPFLLCVGWLGAVERRREEINALCGQVLAARSADELLLARDLRLAVEVAANSAGLVRQQRMAELLERAERFRANLPSFAATQISLYMVIRLARLGSRDADARIHVALTTPSPVQVLAHLLLGGSLSGPGGKHLRDLMLVQLHSEDANLSHIAWHQLLPLWNISKEVRTALLSEIERGSRPACSDIAYRLAERTLEGSKEDADTLCADPGITIHIPSVLADAWDDESVRPKVEMLLRSDDPGVRLAMLRALATPSRGTGIAGYVREALADPDFDVREYAQSTIDRLDLLLDNSAATAFRLLSGESEEQRRLVAENLQAEWWAHEQLRLLLLQLFSASSGHLAEVAYESGFQRIFRGQPELIHTALEAFNVGSRTLRQRILRAIRPHLVSAPDFVDTLLKEIGRAHSSEVFELIRALGFVVAARRDVREFLCDLALHTSLAPEIRKEAILALALVARHEALVWETVKQIVDQAPRSKHEWGIISDAHGVLIRLAEFLPSERLRRGIVLLDGKRVGLLEEVPGGARFTYDDNYLIQPDASQISMTMPLRRQPYESDRLHPFFDNMLPEGWLLSRVTAAKKIDPRDRFGLLLATASDTIGAVSVVADSEDDDT